MAKVKIQGHASGTGILTVTAPNTSSDRTITLPDATGTLLNSDGDGSSLTGLGQVTAKAWARFNSSSIVDSHNTSGFTDNGTGDWTIDWDVDLANGNYAVAEMGHVYMSLGFGAAPAAGSCRVKSYNNSGSAEDADYSSIIAFGD